ncbi:uncharacterized protein LOC126894620 [Daktulosphaira vitifoliae]|uniref:uncharacterized protein LOC126894620 n=1 Tax=Daktulosphaira vitifoliae TaxID=58002 RepID=UPI0021A9A969|nr:uncharacterized protein LOC126894620 [Daktulosphaira vitifoliae]
MEDSEPEECVDDPPQALQRLKHPIVEAFQKISSYPEGGHHFRKITMALLYFICKDYRPFSVVEGKGFRRFIKELAPSYKVPSVNTIKNALDNIYEVIKAALKLRLSNSLHVSLTFDTCDSRFKKVVKVGHHFF